MYLDYSRIEHSNIVFPAELIEQFIRNHTSPNDNPSTLWHGIDDILNYKIPGLYMDNLVEKDLAFLKKCGYKGKGN